MKLSNRVYNVLKYICQIGLPAVLTFLSAVLSLVGVPAETIAIIIGIGTATDTLIGTLLGISSAAYYKEDKGENHESF